MTEELLFKLIRCELWGKPLEESVPNDVLVKVMELAHRQTVSGIVLNPLSEREGGDDWELVSKYISRSLKIRRKNTAVNHELADFARCCQQAGLNIIIVKGQTVAAMYPHPMLRMSGDIDFLIRDSYQDCKEKIEAIIGTHLPERLKEKETSFKRNGTLYELHEQLLIFGSKRCNQYWQRLVDESWKEHHTVCVDGVPIRTLPPTLNAIYIFCHLFLHFIREGVGLRQLCDMAIQLHAYRNEIDRQELAVILEQLDLKKAYRAFGCVLVDKLGLPEESFPLCLEPSDKKWEDSIVKDIFKGGNFGKEHHKAQIGLKFKFETLRLVLRHCIRYYSLAPTELRLFVYKLLKINVRLIFK